MDADARVRHGIGDMYIRLHLAYAENEALKMKIAELEKQLPPEPEKK